MREYKFRAIGANFQPNIMQYGDIIGVEDCKRIRVKNKYDYQSILVDEKTIGQYVGLKDKESVDIYEGDYIVIPDQYPFYDEGELIYVGVVEWIYSQWQFVYKLVDETRNGVSDGINEGLNDTGFEENANTHYKVIGNIHQNQISDFM